MQTLGQKLRAAREKKRFTLSRAAALTRIKIQHLEMMEADDFSKMPAPTYAKGFIRIYAGVLGLEADPLIQEYNDRHLNRPAEEETVERRPATQRDTRPSGEVEGGLKQSLQGLKPALASLGKKLAALGPYAPRLVLLALAVFLLVGITRCAVRMTAESGEEPAGPAMLDDRAIMKEPAPRYFELPTTDDNAP